MKTKYQPKLDQLKRKLKVPKRVVNQALQRKINIIAKKPDTNVLSTELQRDKPELIQLKLPIENSSCITKRKKRETVCKDIKCVVFLAQLKQLTRPSTTECQTCKTRLRREFYWICFIFQVGKHYNFPINIVTKV
ncbi:hypothetical protein ACF0H5_000324 [Mactra antiquata]